MSDYPRSLTLEPIGDWPGEQTTHRQQASFRTPSRYEDGRYKPAARVPLSKTMRELSTELDQLGGSNPRLAVAILSTDLTLDGRIRAGRKPFHPGVILSFDSPRGVQRYPSDQYTHWEDNLRAIVLTLNAIRGIERWGVGDVRSSYLAIESARAMPSAPFSREPADVRRWLAGIINEVGDFVSVPSDPARQLVTRARASTHPDRGGDADTFRHVTTAEQYLREASEL